MEEDIKKSVEVLKNGGVILYPTDTIWGLGCDATIEAAVAKIFEIKKRVSGKSLIAIVNGQSMLEQYVDDDISLAIQHIENTDKPVTIVYSCAKNLAKNMVAENGSVGIRIAKDSFCEKLITAFGKPIVSTSANISNEEFPTLFSNIKVGLLEAVDYVVKHRQTDDRKSEPSQLAKLIENGKIEILRE